MSGLFPTYLLIYLFRPASILRVAWGVGCFVLLQVHVYAQPLPAALPYSATYGLPRLSTYVPVLQDQATTGRGSYRFADRYLTNLQPEDAGEWQQGAYGKVWRIGLHAPQARSLYLTLSSFHLTEGVRLYLYAPGYHDMMGYDAKDTNKWGTLSTPVIGGDRLIVELNIPPGHDTYGSLIISKVYRGFREPGQEGYGGQTDTRTGTCYEGINCAQGRNWQTEKRAVVRIVSDGQMSTGTLIANTGGTSEPYVITANHTMFNRTKAAEAVFYFNDEYPACDKGSAVTSYTLSGSSLVATDQAQDFSLLRLHEVPPASYMPYYAGWDVSGNRPRRAATIHHPWGADKQIAMEYHPLQSVVFTIGNTSSAAWRVAHWEAGTTQPGSSGAPLFNEHHRLTGVLAGGGADCSDPADDYFSKLSQAWEQTPDPAGQLRHWLDPLQTGATTTDGYDPYGFSASYCDTVWNLERAAPPALSREGFAWGSISGHNPAHHTRFAEKFRSVTSNRLPGCYFHIAEVPADKPLFPIKVTVWEGTSYPEKEVYSKLIFSDELRAHSLHYIAFDSLVTVQGTFFTGYEIDYDDGASRFAVYHSPRGNPSRAGSMYVYDGTWHKADELYPDLAPLSLRIGQVHCYGNIAGPEGEGHYIYPNPARDYVSINTPAGEVVYEARCTDSKGRTVPVALSYDPAGQELHFSLPPGSYYLTLITYSHVYTTRLLVLPN
ncbi:trypsin-like peptidase domain-containing protein [Roseivirga sp. BDSF3-8]|uniref:trypsin-like peptidase domain-containing protein n=1 Tax=Roseivirga sp. BDSF3-8 TaxID=3241598 RepID=UPI003531FA3F